MGRVIIEAYYLKVAQHTKNPEVQEHMIAKFASRGLDANIFSTRENALQFQD